MFRHYKHGTHRCLCQWQMWIAAWWIQYLQKLSSMHDCFSGPVRWLQIDSMVERLYSSKPKHGITYKARPTPMKAIYYIENGAHLSRLEPIAPKPAQERTEFMVCPISTFVCFDVLMDRCLGRMVGAVKRTASLQKTCYRNYTFIRPAIFYCIACGLCCMFVGIATSRRRCILSHARLVCMSVPALPLPVAARCMRRFLIQLYPALPASDVISFTHFLLSDKSARKLEVTCSFCKALLS